MKRTNHPPMALVGVLLAAAFACAACSSGAAGTGASADADAGGISAATSCVYQTRTAASCDGDTTTTPWQSTCNDEPCSQESWDPHPVSAGDCWGQTEYQGSFTYPATCSDWEAAGSPTTPPPAAGPDGGACEGAPGFTQNASAACLSCSAQSCCAQATDCSAGTDCDQLRICVEACPACAADAGACPCPVTCEQQHPAGVQAIQAWSQCLSSSCSGC